MTRKRDNERAPMLVDPAPLFALRAMLDQVIAASYQPGPSCATLDLEMPWSHQGKPYVAEVVVTPHGFERAFLRGRRDYTHADKKGRGVREHYVLRPGCVYEVREYDHKRRETRWMGRVHEGAVQRMDKEEVQRWQDGLLSAGLR